MKNINENISKKPVKKAGVIATKYSTNLKLHHKYLSQIGVDTLYPSAIECEYINKAIFDVCSGSNNNLLKINIINIIDKLIKQGAEVIILGCTELGLIINQRDSLMPVIDTALLHSDALVDFSLSYKSYQAPVCG